MMIQNNQPPLDPLFDFFSEGNFNRSNTYYECYKFGFNLAGGLNKSEAVDFMNWKLSDECKYTYNHMSGKWILSDYALTSQTYTTEEVYEAFLLSKKTKYATNK